MSNKSNRQIGDGNTNIQIETFQEDLGIIAEIYKSVLESPKQSLTMKKDHNFVAINKKIEFNISDPEERKRIKKLFEDIYDKINVIEKTFSELDPSQQRTITIDVGEQYQKFIKKNNSDMMQTLEDLFNHYTPKTKSKNPEYNLLARAFVLFFFDDCTIGRKE
ncbi:MAG: hypothetical protein KKB88_04420 [Nanoarchaeota archaeon]|nr:hypothetical protein [Nanoarchaeota archaeon]